MIIPPPGTGGTGEANLLLCHKESGGFLNLNATTCVENSREASSAEAGAIVDAIVASCRIAPTPTPSPVCPSGEPVAGGQTVTVEDSIQVALPAGDFIMLVTGDLAVICNPVQDYSVSLQLSNCRQANIPPPDSEDLEEPDAIVESCTLLHPERPVPAFTPLTEAMTITPPSTGDAGLRVVRQN